ncbi:hypothetical protein AB832_06285 [Flavobacteriaceae bacterium (ex Bugula neritina AB1)]|nr:hypothetical protein AB832_06285 [Flavobacteriaceae bacterium (ex Bugula neritina AB1)]
MLFKIVVIEDYKILLSSFIKIINNSEYFITVGGYTNCEDALDNFQKDGPDIMLVDIQLPGINGIEGIRKFKKIKPIMGTQIARKVVELFQFPHQNILSEIENNVLLLLTKGKSYASIAQELNLSVTNIKGHIRSIYNKLQINSKEIIL